MTTRKKKSPTARMRGLQREAHFKAGGSPAEWRGLKTVQKDRKKEGSKRACRGRVRARASD